MKKGEYKDITGNTYGRLIVQEFVGFKGRISYWRCKCSCGVIRDLPKNRLITGNTKSCGCLKLENGIKTVQGLSSTKEYKAWLNAIDRCSNTEHKSYKDYGGRGIRVSERWLGVDGFKNFYEDMGSAPEGGMLERVDNDNGYSKENCVWSDRSQQGYNQRIRSTNTSGKTGVSWNTSRSKWIAYITIKNKTIHLGYFQAFEEAVKAREEAELKYFGFNKE